MTDYKKELIYILRDVIPEEIEDSELESWIEKPKGEGQGDFSFPCFRLSKFINRDAKDIALLVRDQISVPEKFFEKIEVIGPYVNFFVNRKALSREVIEEILIKKEVYGNSAEGKEKKVIIEFYSPNTNKPLHLGHVRNNSLGESFSKIYEANSFDVFKTTIINDRGIHIMKSMLAYRKWGMNSSPEEEKIKPDHFVGKYYTLFNQKVSENQALEAEAQNMLVKWEQGDNETIELWKKMNLWVYKGFEETYRNYEVEFDSFEFESEIYEKGKGLVDSGLAEKVFEERDGAVVAPLKKFNLPDKFLLRSDGTAIYITQDMYLAKKRFEEQNFDELIYIIGSEQNLYMQQLFAVLKLLGFPWANNLFHLSYGMVYLPEGKMKSREGTVVNADDILIELKEMAEEEIKKRNPEIKEEDLIERKAKIALAAIKFYMLKIETHKDIHFNPKESISFDGETGPYLLYTYARAKSILRKAGKSKTIIDYSMLKEKPEAELISLMSEFPQTVADSLRIKSTHRICHYLIALAHKFNSYYHDFPVISENEKLQISRLALVESVSIVLKNGLKLLAIKVLEEM